MGRPRKNRISEYAALLFEEISFQLADELSRALSEERESHRDDIAELRAELRSLQRSVDALADRMRVPRESRRVGRWVPGGPGRPPKDASRRIQAFVQKSGHTESASTAAPAKKRSKPGR